MCGLIAIVSETNIDQKYLENINQLHHHRGPDDEGYFNDKFGSSFVHFSHKRLSILDLSPEGKQPMSYKDRYEITYNGEIFNYLELKRLLIEDGYSFNTKTDTEVILAAYDKWGIDCLKKFNGMWAFVILDKERDKIFISRDRFGIKPLYYFVVEGLLFFSSEIKAISESGKA